MKSRIITSVVYVVVWLGLCVMKWLVPAGYGALGFDAVFCAISVIGALEFTRAVGGLSLMQRGLCVAFCAMCVPLYVLVQMTMASGFLAVACALCVYVFLLAAVSVFNHEQSTVRGMGTAVFAMCYCGVLSVMLSAVNHLADNSTVAIIFLFLVVMLTDGGAFVIGMLFGRFVPARLAPRVSPNKTIIGAVGGLVGAMLAGVITYFAYNALASVWGQPIVYEGNLHPAVVFMLLGLLVSVFVQIGDLFESAIKRECGVKDMGKLLPGHGGVLDRFDGMLFGGVVALLCLHCCYNKKFT